MAGIRHEEMAGMDGIRLKLLSVIGFYRSGTHFLYKVLANTYGIQSGNGRRMLTCEQPFHGYGDRNQYNNLVTDPIYGYDPESNDWLIQKNFDAELDVFQEWWEESFSHIKFLHIIRSGLESVGSLMYHAGAHFAAVKGVWPRIDWEDIGRPMEDFNVGSHISRNSGFVPFPEGYRTDLRFGHYLACWYWFIRDARLSSNGLDYAEISYEAAFIDRFATERKLSLLIGIPIAIPVVVSIDRPYGSKFNSVISWDAPTYDEPIGRGNDLTEDREECIELYDYLRKKLNNMEGPFVKIYRGL